MMLLGSPRLSEVIWPALATLQTFLNIKKSRPICSHTVCTRGCQNAVVRMSRCPYVPVTSVGDLDGLCLGNLGQVWLEPLL